MNSELAIQKAAQAWCTPETEHIKMDPALCEAFAQILDETLMPIEAPTGITTDLRFSNT